MRDSCAVLDDILSLAGLAPAPRDRVQIAGADPVLPTNFLTGTAGAAALAATGLATQSLRAQGWVPVERHDGWLVMASGTIQLATARASRRAR